MSLIAEWKKKKCIHMQCSWHETMKETARDAIQMPKKCTCIGQHLKYSLTSYTILHKAIIVLTKNKDWLIIVYYNNGKIAQTRPFELYSILDMPSSTLNLINITAYHWVY